MTTALVHARPAQLARPTSAVHSKSFALASKLLGKRLRDQTTTVYTWCRRAGDAVDKASAFAAREELLRLQRELRNVYARTARDPLLVAFGDTVRGRAIPIAYPAALLAGMEMDVASTRYQTVDDVIVYAYRVAGVVGLMMAHVFGVRDDYALVHAAHIGIAMQLTSICRDVADDWNRRRLYIPAELLARHGARDLDGDLGKPLPPSAHAALDASVAELLRLADRYYASGVAGAHALPWRAALAARAARGVYGGKRALVAAAAARTLVEMPLRMFRRGARIPARTLELRDLPRL